MIDKIATLERELSELREVAFGMRAKLIEIGIIV
jgi:hypothetical protein